MERYVAQDRNDFYSLVGFHCEYLRTQILGNLVFYIKQHVWADTVLKSGCVQFLNLLTLTEMGSVQDRKWFLLTHLLSLRIFQCWKIQKCWFSSKIMHLSRRTSDLNSGRGLFWNLLTLTEMHSFADKKLFLLTPLDSLQIFECWKIWKCCFSRKIMHLSRHTCKQWAWSISKFYLVKSDSYVCWKIGNSF